MNQERFDELAQAFATTALSRPQALKTLAAGVLSGMAAPLGGRHAAAQTVCSEIGTRCRKDTECCSDICSRKRRCKCKNAGQSCSESRNCCSEKCCNGRCCGDLQICDNGQCICDELVYETCGATCCPLLTQECRNDTCCTPCGSACCPALTHECRNGTCCKQLGVACSGNAQCCSGQCQNGKCASECPASHPVRCAPTAQAPEGWCCPPCTLACGCPNQLPDPCCTVPPGGC